MRCSEAARLGSKRKNTERFEAQAHRPDLVSPTDPPVPFSSREELDPRAGAAGLDDRIELVWLFAMRAFPSSDVRLKVEADKIVITGQADDAVEELKIFRLLRANAPSVRAYFPRTPNSRVSVTLR